MLSHSVLVVDDDRAIAHGLARLIQLLDVEVEVALGGPEAIAKLNERTFDVVVCDMMMPEIDGIGVLDHTLANRRARGVVLVTAASSVPLAVEAMRRGAADFLGKPVDKATLHTAIKRFLQPVPGPPEPTDDWRSRHAPDLIGSHPTLIDALTIIERVSSLECTVLITGASGTGKELCARALHNGGSRAGKPFIAVNCAAIPKDLMESELFGHAKGAFSGATERREGKFQSADGGTLFLDEIGEMHLDLQAKLLRVIQDKEVTAVGDTRSRKIDVRIVAATNRDLAERAAAGTFREDLYYRLNVIPLELPTLRERVADIPQLTQHFIRWANARHARKVTGIDRDVEAAFAEYPWRGNVRELQNVIERLVILSRGPQITMLDLPPQMRISTPMPRLSGADAGTAGASLAVDPAATPIAMPRSELRVEPGLTLDQALEDLERRLTIDALQKSGGNKAKAAEMLGLKRTTLVERLKKLSIPDPV